KPELCAAKLAAIRNLEYPELLDAFEKRPRMKEVLWFIQWASWQPGGLAKLAAELLECCPHRIGTKTMRAVGHKAIYSRSEFVAINEELHYQFSDFGDVLTEEAGFKRMAEKAMDGAGEGWLAETFMYQDEATFRIEPPHIKKAVNAFLLDHSPSKLVEWLRMRAMGDIPGLLARFCTEAGNALESPCYFDGLLEGVMELMDAHAKKASKGLAMTEVARMVFDGLEFAYANSAAVSITGDSRFGKTEAIKTWCQMYPGRARLVNIPCSNSDRDMFRAMIEAFGEVCCFGDSLVKLRERAEFIISQGGVLIVADEFHFAFPQRYSETTPPMRLNWFRTRIMDKGVPCVFVNTPQAYRHALDRFVRKTGFTFEQFVGRVARKIVLPSELGVEDLQSVVEIHFPNLELAHMQFIVGASMASESYLKTVENLARLASWFAKKSGRSRVELDDLDRALAEVIPQDSTVALPAQTKPAKRSEACRNRCAVDLRPPAARQTPLEKPTAFALQSSLNAPETHARTSSNDLGEYGQDTQRMGTQIGCPGSTETVEVLA
ncbi:MAG TPA: AAA family ATPase, partial [Candidatus Paceibacterota bacterium]|nr:AAA family ATPase [Candidatus Paceibacterota bacterium]